MKELQAAGRGKQQPISFNHWSSGRRVRKTSCVSVCVRERRGGGASIRGFHQARAQNMMTVFITLRQVRSGGGARVWAAWTMFPRELAAVWLQTFRFHLMTAATALLPATTGEPASAKISKEINNESATVSLLPRAECRVQPQRCSST